MDSPFDDPEFLAQLAAKGVSSPGSGKRMLDEIAPLLAAEGIDLDDLGDADLDEVNAALARAAERYNLSLVTPVGAQRSEAQAVLGVFAEGLADKTDRNPWAVLSAVEVEPGNGAAAISHVIGVAIERLDDWYTNPAWDSVLARNGVPRRGSRAAQAAAKDVLALARKGRAFASIDRLHRGHSGLAIFHGAALLVGDAVVRRAEAEGVDVRAVTMRELTGAPRLRLVRDGAAGAGAGAGGAGVRDGAGAAGGAGSSFVREGTAGSSFVREGTPGSSFVRPAAPSSQGSGVAWASGGSIRSGDRVMLREFAAWLRRQDDADAAGARGEAALLEELLLLAREEGFDLYRSDDFDTIVDLVLDVDADDPDADDAAFEALEVLHDYVHFRIDTAADPEPWEPAHEEIELALAEFDDGDMVVADAIAATATLDTAERWAGLMSTPVIAGVGELLEWIGAGQAVTSTGSLRRADIERAAGMIGIAAVGVSKRAASAPGEPVQATSMFDVPMLAAWWEALQIADVIEVTRTRVRRGEAADRWGQEGGSGVRGTSRAVSAAKARGSSRTNDGPKTSGLELAEQLIGLVVADLATGAGAPGAGGYGEEVIRARVDAVLMTVDPSREAPDIDGLREWERYLVVGLIVDLVQLRLVDPQGGSGPEVPLALKAAVAKGATLAMAYFAAMSGLLE